MGTLRVNAIEDASGNTSYNVENLNLGRAKAWVRFTVAGVIEESFNVSSITKIGTGNWTVFFDEDMPTTQYAVTIGAMTTFNTHGGYMINNYLTTSVQVTNISAGLVSDVGVQVCIAVFGE